MCSYSGLFQHYGVLQRSTHNISAHSYDEEVSNLIATTITPNPTRSALRIQRLAQGLTTFKRATQNTFNGNKLGHNQFLSASLHTRLRYCADDLENAEDKDGASVALEAPHLGGSKQR